MQPMSQPNYSRISVLIADDFSNFRSSVNSMLQSLGVQDIETVGGATEAITSCERRQFDLILCDYNLGPGRTGQHVLEELRFRSLINYKTVFIMVSAEASRNIVMSAFDCQPDDYLMKPINAQMLGQRMSRLLAQRKAFENVFEARAKGDNTRAIELLVDLSLEENRNALMAQKLLGELFMEEGLYHNAEKLYTKALEVRPLEWARLGLARVKQAKGELDVAETWLEKMIDDNPLYLPAYDTLASNWEKKGDNLQLQETVQKAVAISPMSILRQRQLSDIAQVNGDFGTCVDALRRTIKLGEYSCYGSANNHFQFARVVSTGMERKVELSLGLSEEALRYLNDAKNWYSLNATQSAQCNLLGGRIHAASGEKQKAAELLNEAMEQLNGTEANLEALLDQVSALLSIGRRQNAEELLMYLQELYSNDENALRQLDAYLDEPASEASRSLVAAINKEGIELYNQQHYDAALVCFEKARKRFPRHIGIQLNIAQALIGKLKSGHADRAVTTACRASLDLVASLIDKENPQYDRYLKLRQMAATTME